MKQDLLARTALLTPVALLMIACSAPPSDLRTEEDFGRDWRFHLGDVSNGQDPAVDDAGWRMLRLPHDWSIEGEFSSSHPAGHNGGALPGGIGWYRKSFTMPWSDSSKLAFIEFDGVYRNSEVWINGHYLGKRPYGYISFRYELTAFLKYGPEPNILAVKVDNSRQPNSRWYSGSGIYRNVWLARREKLHVDHRGTYITTSDVSTGSATVSVRTRIRNRFPQDRSPRIITALENEAGETVARAEAICEVRGDSVCDIAQTFLIGNPDLWSIERPRLMRAVTRVEHGGQEVDRQATTFGIRTFRFDNDSGFVLNGRQVKITGVCNHHDLGCLGAAVNRRALERQLEILKAMGVNGIRTSHNPPAPELLDLCDRMGFVVMDEAFDMWKKPKTEFDYSLDWDAWHVRDLEDMVYRDRNHPSVFIWSIGNEVPEQWDPKDSSGAVIARELAGIIRRIDPTRPITAGCNNQETANPVIRSGALDLIGYNYAHEKFEGFPDRFPGRLFIGSETTSALATRGEYDMPADSVRRWPTYWDRPFRDGNPGLTCSAYDNCSAPWGSTHEETWKVVKKHAFLSGMFIWTGFDYLGEPTPYPWPARSSYFGIVDLAGFPKDSYYMYQSEWTETPVLHLFPHWNWKAGDTVDVWAYTNCDSVELFLNGTSRGTKAKAGDDLHLAWKVPFAPGTLKAVGHRAGKEPMVREVKTAGAPAKILLEADRTEIVADGRDLGFITAKVLDEAGTLVPHADNLVTFEVGGVGRVIGVDNGLQTSHEPFVASSRRAFNGLCLAVIQSGEAAGNITVTARSAGLQEASVGIVSRPAE